MLSFIIFTLFFLVTGAALSSYFSARPLTDGELETLLLSKAGAQIYEGWISSSPDIGLERTQFVVDLTCYLKDGACRPVRGRARLTVMGGLGDISFGDIVRFKATLKIPVDYKNPGAISFENYYRSQGIAATGTIGDVKWITRSGEVEGLSFRKRIERMRRDLTLTIYSMSSPEASGVMAALVTGMRNGVSFDIKESFRLTGVIHVLVISGLHVGFVAMMFWWMLRWLFVRVEWIALRGCVLKFAAVLTVIAVWFYALLAGAGIPTVRAAIMVTVYFAAVIIDRRSDIYQSLSIALIIIVGMNPLSLFDPSLQLTFAAVFGLAAIARPLSEILRVEKWPRYFRWVGESFSVSTAATVGVGPLIAYYFCQVSLVGFVANLLVVPIVGFALVPLGMVGALATLLSNLASRAVFGWMGIFCEWLIKLVRWMADVGSGLVPYLAPTQWEVLLFYFLVACIVWRKDIPFRRYVICMAAALFAGGVLVQQVNIGQKSLEVVFLDVGQGASIFVKFPTGKTMLIDGGGIPGSRFDIGKNVVAPYLWRKGIRKIDWVILTHPHPDHFKGLSFIIEHFKPKSFYHNGMLSDDADLEDWNALMKTIQSAGVEQKVVSQEDVSIEEGGVSVSFLSPPKDGPLPGWTTNDGSLVMRIDYKERSFLVTGDVEALAERWLIEQKADLVADVLQVPHHGSKTSSGESFLKQVRPEYAVVQAGLYNRYSFPNMEIVDRLKNLGVQLFRTDLDGAVIFRSDGHKLSVEKTVEREDLAGG